MPMFQNCSNVVINNSVFISRGSNVTINCGRGRHTSTIIDEDEEEARDSRGGASQSERQGPGDGFSSEPGAHRAGRSDPEDSDSEAEIHIDSRQHRNPPPHRVRHIFQSSHRGGDTADFEMSVEEEGPPNDRARGPQQRRRQRPPRRRSTRSYNIHGMNINFDDVHGTFVQESRGTRTTTANVNVNGLDPVGLAGLQVGLAGLHTGLQSGLRGLHTGLEHMNTALSSMHHTLANSFNFTGAHFDNSCNDHSTTHIHSHFGPHHPAGHPGIHHHYHYYSGPGTAPPQPHLP
ncbi:hypothetical protein CC1G_15289 [Coprinopsis cinerea okayama7|uniref:Uncharacterized protein n=1 Tax=Coprinopsis cinerea (strain Okayama-7 / 130 / ATCC MYA-4618 / FGSC 9003) TaxID=240176 RepID=D6RQ82_COPC7|nr:hypothetical protein CC1G_15289 [Coprinopsis cinerea okayama7\|eukprot:XP_002910382.1 hypothetical protein CC1G_15289 [Coprinopsis cinerea okayama7\